MKKVKQKLGPIQTKWVKGLEGKLKRKYKQTQGALCKVSKSRHYSYCCLGVLCDIVKNQLNLNITKEYSGRYGSILVFDGRSGFLPDEVKNIVKISGSGEAKLMDINDQSNNFKDVIKYIKENPEKVFYEPA
jgi:hypothetical protein